MKDQQRIEVVQALMDGRLTVAQAAQVLGRSERQVWRLPARARADGLAGLLHASCRRAPVNKSDEGLWRRVLKLAAEKYRGVNDRHLQELLAREHGLEVCRERRAAAGMLLQIDASPHDWLEGRGPHLTLVGAIDDATNRCWVRFAEAETTWADLALMRRVALSAGLPRAPRRRGRGPKAGEAEAEERPPGHRAHPGPAAAGEFPQVHRPPFESREVLRLLRHRHKLVQIRTRAENGLQALAFSAGSSGRSRLLSRAGREQFLRPEMSEAMTRQPEGWLSLVDDLNRRIKGLDRSSRWLCEREVCAKVT